MTLFDLDPEPRPPAATGEGSPAPAGSTRLRMVVAYDGSSFRGFAAQAGQHTVAGVLAEAIATVARHEVELTCAGRTDAGVHALGQVVSTDVRADLDLARLVKSVNAMLSPAVVVREASFSPGFDARRGARARHYRYLVLEAATTHPLLDPVSWLVPGPLDLRAMKAAADAVIGEHDFGSFCRRPPRASPGEPIVRRVLDTAWSELAPRPDGLAGSERVLRFDIVARSFCHQMVRSLVGTMVEVGRGRRRAADLAAMLRTPDRSTGTTIAPPQGLCLVAVDYVG